MRLVELRVTNWFGRWMFRRGWRGVTFPLPLLCVILYWRLRWEDISDQPIAWRRWYYAELCGSGLHEMEHYAQAQRYGWLGWWIRYAWGMRRGYRMNPLEVEAYDVQREVK